MLQEREFFARPLGNPIHVMQMVATIERTVATNGNPLRLRHRNLYIVMRTMAKSIIVWFGMKLTPEQKQKIKTLARREGVSAKEAIMQLVDRALQTEKLDVPKDSFLYGIEHLIGSIEGPGDLSTNPKYMEGFGE